MALPQEVRYTLADALSWDEHAHIELIHGRPVQLGLPPRVHQAVLTALFGQLYSYLKRKNYEAYPAPFAVRPFEENGDRPEDVDTLVEPDISVICDPGKLDDLGCKGAPDLIIEILSPSTRRHDRMTKFNLYQRAGVREYWIVDPDARDVQTFLLDGGRYFVSGYGSGEDKLPVAVLEDCVIDLSAVFAE